MDVTAAATQPGSSFPAFFDQAPRVTVRDPLARLLGACADGVVTYCYADAVRLAGHSCPTVAGAFLSGRAALAALYPDEIPHRGGVAVRMPEPEDSGTTGVVAQVLTLLTGAAGSSGFKGLAGQHARNGLLRYAPAKGPENGVVRFERLDTGSAVAVRFDSSRIPVDAAQRRRMQAVARGEADTATLAAFAAAWQERVRRLLLEHADDPETVQVTTAAPGCG
ncbi:MAG TPA: hypothetical protein VK973_14590 [Arenicellales bacterium]|nr:hypothetical protein [Arenicellales bacterium]